MSLKGGGVCFSALTWKPMEGGRKKKEKEKYNIPRGS